MIRPYLALIALLVLPLRAALVADSVTYESQVKPFLAEHCVSCHGPDKQKGTLRLDTLAVDFGNAQAAGMWTEVMDNINLGEMPPEDEPQPDGEAIAAVANWVAAELRHARRAGQSTGGRVLMRRLNRSEYANMVRDLLNVDFLPNEGPMDLLPPDGTLDGFDKLSKALLLDPSLMSQYFDVAARVADKALVLGPPPVPTRRNRMQYEDISGGIEYIKSHRSTTLTDEGIITREQGMRSDHMLQHPWLDKTLIPVRGTYRLRLRVGADPGDRGEPMFIRLTRSGDGDLYAGKVSGTIEAPEIIEVLRPFDVPGGSEIGVRLENASSFQRVNYYFTDLQRRSRAAAAGGDNRLSGRLRAQMGAEGMLGQSRPEPASIDTSGFPAVFFDWIELEGPLYEQWPPKSTETILFRGIEPERFTADYAREIVAALLPRAYRRPVSEAEIDGISSVALSELAAGEAFPEAIKASIIAMLCSPSFLLLHEPSGDSAAPLPGYQTATRLSVFLWSSMPDAALIKLAAADGLRDAGARRVQVRRMLADPRAEAFVDGFAGQWLKAHEFDRFAVDRNLYRDFYAPANAGLNEAINREPVEFFRELLTSDLPLTEMLSSDWTMLNEPLARYYGVDGVNGRDFVRVQLPEALPRGGLVTMAALHKWGSDGNRTKPVERGKYILDVLFNDPPNPPPPNVGEVEPNVQGEDLTVRQRLDQHRTIESCAACHRGIDPYGIGLENFNVVGLWRTKQDGERGWWPDRAQIDASGTLPNGTAFAGFEEFQSALAAQSDRFLRGVTEKMLVYALGRTLEPGDRAVVEELMADMARQNNTPRSLIEAIVAHELFVIK